MELFIPSTKRAHLQETVHPLAQAGLQATIVVPHEELQAYAQNLSVPAEVIATPANIRGIAATRQWIMEHSQDNKVCMLDDDLVFFKRRDDDRTKLRDSTSDELREAFQSLSDVLDAPGVAHAGFATREGANRNVAQEQENTRILRVLAYRKDILEKEHITFGRMPVMEDFDVALRLLRAGYDNVILNNYCHNQRGSGTEGGCSTYRTMEMQAAAAHKLAALHPGFVKVVQKETKTAWGGGTRTDVNIAWKKARRSADE